MILQISWTPDRVQLVADVLLAKGIDPSFLRSDNIINLDWTGEFMGTVEAALDSWLSEDSTTLPLPYDEVVHRQAQVHAALREIREYRQMSQEVAQRIKASGEGKGQCPTTSVNLGKPSKCQPR